MIGSESSIFASTFWQGAARVAIVLGVTALVALLYWPTTETLIRVWSDTENLSYTHGALIVGLFVWLVFRQRARLLAAPLDRHPSTLFALAAAGILWLVAFRAGIEIVTQLVLPVLGWLGVRMLLGRQAASVCAFAFAYLYFAVPIWDFGNDALQYLTVGAVRIMLALAGIPAYVEGNLVHIPDGVFEIAGGCSGLHFFVVATAIGALYGEVHGDRPRSRLLLLVIAAVLAVICNWIRVFAIIAAGHYTHMQHALIQQGHYYFGWQVFAVTMLIYFLIARRLPLESRAGQADMSDVVSVRPILRFAPFVVALLAAAPLWAMATTRQPAGTIADERFALPAVSEEWTAIRGTPTEWQPRFAGADFIDAVTYRGQGHTIEAYTAVYLIQAQGKELVSYDNAVNGSLSLVRSGRGETPWGPMNEWLVTGSQGMDSLIWFRYEVDGLRTASGIASQLYYGINALMRAPVARVVALRTDCRPDCAAAQASLLEFSTVLGQAMSPLD